MPMISATYEIWVERHTICLPLRKVSQEHADMAVAGQGTPLKEQA